MVHFQGLIDAIQVVFPTADHRFCCRHIFVNFCRKFTSLGLRNYFCTAARSTSGYDFWTLIKEMKSIGGGKPFDYLVEITLKSWARHAFSTTSKSEHYINNMTEPFNSWLGKI